MDTITLQEALAGFTANESAALGSYIGLSSGGAGQKQSIAALAKVAGGLKYQGVVTGTLAELEQSIAFVRFSDHKPSDIPSDNFDFSYVITFYLSSDLRLQFCISNTNISYRRRYGASYSAWTTLL